MKAAVLALKAGAEREALKADVPRRSAEAIVVVDCEEKEKYVGRERLQKSEKLREDGWIPERSPGPNRAC